MEYVATETTVPHKNADANFLAQKILPCPGGYVIAYFQENGEDGDFTLLRALPDPSHGGYTLDYRLICAVPIQADCRFALSDLFDPNPVALCALPGNRVLGAMSDGQRGDHKLVAYQLHDQQSKCLDLSDLNSEGLQNYALWDSLTLRISTYASEARRRHHLSHTRRMSEQCELRYERDAKAERDSKARGQSMRRSAPPQHPPLKPELLRMLLKISPLAKLSPDPVGTHAQEAKAEALLIQKQFQIPDIWLRPFIPSCDITLAPRTTHLLPLPPPYEHVVVCWDAVNGSFVLFNSKVRSDVGDNTSEWSTLQSDLNIDGAAMMYAYALVYFHLFDLLFGICWIGGTTYESTYSVTLTCI
jgi:hypothetical protein